jgi:apolipoprotein N-acyltransferase
LGKLRGLRSLARQPDEWSRIALAAAAGLLLAAAFPKPGLAGFGWVAPGLLLAAAMGARGATAFRVGYVAGLAHFLASLYWLLFIPVRFAPVAGWLALAAYLALYPAFWVWLCWKLYPSRLDAPAVIPLLDEFLAAKRWSRLRWTVACAALWVAGEMVRGRLLSGFPWNLLGASQYRMLPLTQIASLTGVYGVSFLMAWFSVSLIGTVAALVRQPEKRQTWSAELALPILAFMASATYGMRQIFKASPAAPTLKVALVQPSIPQKTIWDPHESAQRLQQVLALSEAALTNQPDLLVWPEAAVPSLFRWDTNVYGGSTLYDAVTGLARRHRVWMVIGADDAAPNPEASDGADYFNASFLISPGGEIAGIYRKRRLVIFGEYVPLARWLPFLRKFTGVTGDFTPGTAPVPFRLDTLRATTSVLICFEDIFPHGTREHLENDTDFLLNLTNNGWFGESAAQWQHAANASFRAIENGLPLVRCANNGLTCWVDAQGRMNEVRFPGTSDIYRSGVKVAHVPLLAGNRRMPTFYQRHGDWFGWACIGFSAWVVAGTHFLRPRRARASQE